MKRNRKLITFRAAKGELDKYRQYTETEIGDSFYHVANAGSEPGLVKTIAEHTDSSNDPLPEPGYRLTESVPGDRDHFQDNGWEVSKVVEYRPVSDDPEDEPEFAVVAICYCVWKPLPEEEQWISKYHRFPVTVDSFGGDETKFQEYLATSGAKP